MPCNSVPEVISSRKTCQQKASLTNPFTKRLLPALKNLITSSMTRGYPSMQLSTSARIPQPHQHQYPRVYMPNPPLWNSSLISHPKWTKLILPCFLGQLYVIAIGHFWKQSSLKGHTPVRIQYNLLINFVGIRANHIMSQDNIIVDCIKCFLIKLDTFPNFLSLSKEFLQLQFCRCFHPSAALVLLIFNMSLTLTLTLTQIFFVPGGSEDT